jgi:hypothetical protein
MGTMPRLSNLPLQQLLHRNSRNGLWRTIRSCSINRERNPSVRKNDEGSRKSKQHERRVEPRGYPNPNPNTNEESNQRGYPNPNPNTNEESNREGTLTPTPTRTKSRTESDHDDASQACPCHEAPSRGGC